MSRKHKGKQDGDKRAADVATCPRVVAKPPKFQPTVESRPARWLWLAAAIMTFWSFGFTTMLGSDLWWHLSSGDAYVFFLHCARRAARNRARVIAVGPENDAMGGSLFCSVGQGQGGRALGPEGTTSAASLAMRASGGSDQLPVT